MSSSFNWLTTSFSWIRRGRKAHFQPKAPRFRPVIENLEGRLNPAPVASLPQLLDMPHSLVVLSPDIASQVPVAEYAGARVLTLDPTRDAISQISDSLAGQSSVTSLRVIGHGQPGSLSLAGQTINLATLQTRSVEVAGWASHLTPDADILLYGCSVASTAGGRAFVNTLATLTGADVAASSDATGAGGNLTLEYTAGAVTDHLQASSQAWTKSGLQLPSEGDYNYDTNPDGTSVTITGYTGSGGAVTIPGTLGGLAVTAIGKSAFEGSTNVTSVTIPEGVTSIGDYAFRDCTSLTGLTIPASVTSIGERTFASCTSLTGVTISEGVTSIGKDAFGWCSSLTSVTIPASATSIGVGAFYSCSSLTSVTILSGITTIEAWSFASCSSLTSFTIPSSVTSIGVGAFADCTSLTGMTIPASVTSIGERTFASCTSLTGLTISEGVTSIGKDAFGWCSSLASVTIPASATSIGVGAFYSCSSLTSVTILDSFFSAGVTTIEAWSFASCSNLTSFTIPSSVTSIGYSAFAKCTSLTSLTIPESVTSIKDEAFSNCTSLALINTLGNAPTLGGSNVFYQVPATLYYTSGTTGWTNPWGGLPTVEMTEGGYQFSINPGGTSVTITGYTGPGGAVTIPDTLVGFPVTAIGNYAFYFSSSLTSVTIPASVTSIGFGAFESCSSLTAIEVDAGNNDFSSRDGILFNKAQTTLIQCPGRKEGTYTIPEGVTSIGNNAFSRCTSLTGVTILEGVTSIGNHAFYRCTSLTGVTVPEGVTSIGDYVFYSCTSLTGVNIPEGVTSIGDYVFNYCTSLTGLTIPASVTSIGEKTFASCTSLTWVTIPEGVTSIGKAAFDSCSRLTSVTIPEGVTSIGESTFDSCSSLTSVTIPKSVNSIEDFAFYSCTSLTSVTIPEGVTSIGDFAFSSCSSLTSVTIPEGVTSIGDFAFSSCSSLTSVTIPEGVTSIGESAFAGCSSLTAIEVDGTNNDFSSRDGILFNKAQTILIQYPGGKAGTYTIPSSVTSIGGSAFESCNGLTSVTIPASVNFIGVGAFSNCSGLTSVTIPESVTSIGIWVFVDCSSLTAIEVDVANNNFSSVGGVLFNKAQTTLMQCPAGKAGTYTIPGSVTSIGEGALASCSSLTSVTIPSSVTSIGDYAFSDCYGLTRINSLGNAPALGDYDVFANVPATLYYTSGTTGWTNPWGGLPTFEMTEGGYQFSINLDGTSVTVTGYTGPGGAINIPATLTGLPVTRIGEFAFQENNSLTSVTIPEGVTSIGEQAFGWCNSLTSVTIPGTVTSFERAAFYSCSSLTSVTILPGVTTIEDWAFASCSSLTGIEVDAANNDFSSRDGILFNKAQTTLIQCPGGKEGTYTIPEGVTSIGNGAFFFCKSLTSVTIPEGVTSIGDFAFDSCGGLTSVTIPKSVTSIGEWAFSSCSSLTSLTILEGVTSIGNVAFGWCNSLTSVTIPGTVTSIGEWAFSSCSSLTAIEVDGTNNDFSSRDGILFNKAQTILIQYPGGKAGTYTIPSSVTSIGGGAFDSCNGLTSVTIPESVTSIGDYAFSDCYGLTRINSLGNAPALGDDDVFADVPATLYYTSGTTGWTNPWGGLPTVEMTGGDYQFSINPDSTSVTITGYTGPGGAISIPATLAGLPVTAIGEAAFQENSSLTSVTIPEGVTSIGESAFAVCVSLTSVTIPESVTSIGVSIFTSCSSLISVTIPESVTSIGEWAFADCSSLTSLTIPYSVTFIGEWAFSSCSSLTAIEVDGTNNDFSSRNGILFNKAQTILIQYPAGIAGTYTIPSSVISIGGGAFYSCGGLTSVTISEGVNSIGDYAFSSCSILTRINTLGNAPALVGSDVFYQVPATLYYTSGTTGWTNPWGGLPTVESSPVAAPFSLAAGSTVASLGNGQIGIWSANGGYQAISPFPGYTGPLNVNTVNRADGQNADTLVVAVAGRSSPHVLTIDSSTGFVISSFYAFDPGFLGGVTVAGGVTRIGGVKTTVILCGAGSGSSPSVSVFNAASSQPMGAFYAYSNQYLGGVRVALSEAGADGTSFAVIGSTINSHVVAFDLNDYYKPILSFHAFHDNLTPQGIYVASGDLDDDNLNEMVVGAGQGTASPQVVVFGMDGKLKKSFNAFDMSFLGGVQVGVADYNKDGKLDILAASGVGAPGTLNVFNYDNLALLDSVFISDSTMGSDVASNFSRG